MANESRIFLSSPHMSDQGYEMQYIQEAFDTNWIALLGKNVDEFENELARYVGIGYAAALSSGTAAIHLALKAAGVGAGDIVFCPSLTFSATANPIIYQNATPVFIDSDYETWNMSPAALEKAFEKYPNVKVVLVVLFMAWLQTWIRLLRYVRSIRFQLLRTQMNRWGPCIKVNIPAHSAIT